MDRRGFFYVPAGAIPAALIGAAQAQPTAPAAADAVIRRVRGDGVLRVGLAESQPFTVKNPGTGRWEGMNVELAEDLATAMGARAQFVDVTYATMIAALLAGQFDVIMAPAFATPERALSVVFTGTYMTAGEVVLIHRDARFAALDDLNAPNVTFAVLGGTTNERTARTRFPRAQVRTFATDTQVAPVLEVANRRADANVADVNSARLFLRANPNAPLRILESGRMLNQSRRAFMIRPGDWHFLNFLNSWIEGTQLSGRLEALFAKYDVG